MEGLGRTIGAQLRGGEIIELHSDLGGGKTTFVRGLAHGMGSADRVASPTFMLRKEYAAGKLTLYHFDFYRLQEAGSMADELTELMELPDAVIAVEWADVVAHVLPDARLRIMIVATGELERSVTIFCPPQLAYLVAQVAHP